MKYALKRVYEQAAGHVKEREPGWGRWQTTMRLCSEALTAVGELSRCEESAAFEGVRGQCVFGVGHPGNHILERIT